jgi:lambda family phage minor tail protein L
MNSIDGAIEGAKLKVIRTKARFLDSGATPSTTNGILQQSNLVITQISSFIPGEAIVLVGSSPLDYGGGESNCPSRPAHTGCPYRYRGSEGCLYAGTAMFKLDGSSTTDPKEDKCAKNLSSCALRGNTLFYGGFPTMQRR